MHLLSVLVLRPLWFAWFLILHLLLAPTRTRHSSATAAEDTYNLKKWRERKQKLQLALGSFPLVEQSQISSHPLTSTGSSSSFTLLLVLLGASTSSALWQDFLLHHVNDLIRDPQILDGASSDVAFRHSPEFVSILSSYTNINISININFDISFWYKTFIRHHIDLIWIVNWTIL